ncbi:MAG: DDE-type integrase/transposase/recombinase [Slackia sp.]|uniref:DDE-type integrase/transposase/recombinase n=1 Tax=uncultured Slackia sp. TaxID=665903 RepID=UPI002803FE60|nr:DDE-type integrase/transposase/recombinase [uncultured Slackia sp.]MDU6011600.1 DDE-type integrase/transposase/recombinase [Slackia sp.]
MRVGRKCGEKTEVDWAGDPIECYGPDTGLVCRAWVFVACLPWSQYTFAEAFPDMGEESWVTAHVRAFASFGGSTPILVPDNCKTGIVKNTVGEPIVNDRYRRMAEHYGCAIVPARPRRPRDKGSVEAAVGLVERQATAPPATGSSCRWRSSTRRSPRRSRP